MSEKCPRCGDSSATHGNGTCRAEARRQLDEVLDLPWPSEKLWRESVLGMREVLAGEDVAAARAVLAEVLGTIRCQPAEEPGYVVAEMAARRLLMAAGSRSGRWVGSGGLLCNRLLLPCSVRKRPIQPRST